MKKTVNRERWLLIGLFALVLLVSLGGSPVWAHHTDPDSWAETPVLIGCNHCHSINIQFGANQGDNRDKPSVGDTRSIVHSGIAGGRMGLPAEGQVRTHITTKLIKTSWPMTVDFMTAKEAFPLPFSPPAVADYMSRCYSATAVSTAPPGTCIQGAFTVNNDCTCSSFGTPEPHNPPDTVHPENVGPVPPHIKIGNDCSLFLSTLGGCNKTSSGDDK